MDPYKLTIIQEIGLRRVDDKTFIASHQGQLFSIGEMMFFTLKKIKENNALDHIAEKISEKYNVLLSKEKLSGFIQEFVNTIEGDEKSKTTLYSDYVYLKLKLLGEQHIKTIARFFAPLFNKFVLLLLFPAAIIFSLWFLKYLYYNALIFGAFSIKDTTIGILLAYLSLLVLAMFHEFGHASAAERFGEPSESIGFGFYLIFPVFYTDVTRIWNLNKWKRIVVNIGGIYFQTLTNFILVAAYFNTDPGMLQTMCKYFFLTNILYFVYCLNPFFRNDGYWIYSDLFNLPNLTSQARRFPKTFWTKYIQSSEMPRILKVKSFIKDLPLMVYASLYLLIMPLAAVALIYLTYLNVIGVSELVNNISIEGLGYIREAYKEVWKLVTGLIINLYFIIRVSRIFIKKYTTAKTVE